MINKSQETRVWKVSVGAKMDVEKVESVLREALEMVQEKAYEGIELHRVDVKEDETVAFITGEEVVADTLIKTLQVYAPKAKVDISEAKASDIYKLP